MEVVHGTPGPDSLMARRLDARVKSETLHTDDWSQLAKNSKLLTRLYKNVLASAKARNLPVTLTIEELSAIAVASCGHCQVSGIKFYLSGEPRHPFSPSIDRRDSTKGYTVENCRLVSLIANVALSNWGDDVLHRFCTAVVKHNNEPGMVHMWTKDPQTAPKSSQAQEPDSL